MVTLNSIVASQTTQMKTLAQENFDQFVLCKDTIDEIAGEINKVESSADGAMRCISSRVAVSCIFHHSHGHASLRLSI